MRVLIYMVFTLAFLTQNLFAQDSRQFGTFNYNISKYEYAYYLPDNFDPEKIYPVLIGPGEGIEGSDKSFFWNVDDPGQFGWILIEFSIWKQNTTVVKMLLKELNTKFKVEGEKFHIVGFSANSASAFGHVISNPKQFHSVTGIPGHPSSKNKDQLENFKEIRVQNIVGKKDSYWLKSAEEFEALYKELGINSTLVIIPDGEHVLSQLVGAGFMEKIEGMRK